MGGILLLLHKRRTLSGVPVFAGCHSHESLEYILEVALAAEVQIVADFGQ